LKIKSDAQKILIGKGIEMWPPMLVLKFIASQL